MKYLVDYHMHSNFSIDSREDLDKIAERAIELGLSEIVITDHFEPTSYKDVNSGLTLDMDTYVSEILKLKEKYKDKIDIKLGVEVGIHKGFEKIFSDAIDKYPIDFVIASSHGADTCEFWNGEFYHGKSVYEAHRAYFLNVLHNVTHFDNFSVYGHLDFISRYGGGKYKILDYDAHFPLISEILEVLIKKGKGIEVNTSGYRYGINDFYPNERIIKRYLDLGGEIITLGSDAHKSSDIALDFGVAIEKLKKVGVKKIATFKRMKVSYIDI